MQTFEAQTSKGVATHAVVADDLSRDRADKVYLTACGQRVSGSRTYRRPFVAGNGLNASRLPCLNCDNALKRKGSKP